MSYTKPNQAKRGNGTKVVVGSSSANRQGLSKPPKPSGNATK